jgi:hypothetical protein
MEPEHECIHNQTDCEVHGCEGYGKPDKGEYEIEKELK